MKNFFLPLAFAASFSTFSFAEDYQFDVEGVLTKNDLDSLNTDGTILSAGIRYHFKAVNTSHGPLAEAGYLSKSSNISISKTNDISDDLVVDSTSLSAEIYIPNSIFYLRVGYQTQELPNGVDLDDSTTIYYFGLTPVEGLLVTTKYIDDLDYETNLDAKYYMPLFADNSLVFRAGFVDVDGDGHSAYAGADYYFNQRTGIGFSYSNYDFSNYSNSSSTEIHATHFFTETAYAGISFRDNDTQDVIALSGGFRF